jgi:hypothetical protein
MFSDQQEIFLPARLTIRCQPGVFIDPHVAGTENPISQGRFFGNERLVTSKWMP